MYFEQKSHSNLNTPDLQVQMMKEELQQASDESKNLTDKLSRLEQENRQLGAVVHRLGGQDARHLKHQVRRRG